MIIRHKKEIVNAPTRYYSNKQEQGIAKHFNGRRILNSGATLMQKGDVLLDNMLIECKTKMTTSASISIKKSWLEKNNREALFMGKPYSVLAFNFGPDEKNYYIIDDELFEILIKKGDGEND